jgi:hypothetical protein
LKSKLKVTGPSVVLNTDCAFIKFFSCNHQCKLWLQTDVSIALCATGIRNVRFELVGDKANNPKKLVAKASSTVADGAQRTWLGSRQPFCFVFGMSQDKISPWRPDIPTDTPKFLE